jgi:hypothetical protein
MAAIPLVPTRFRMAVLVAVATLLQQACGDDSAPLSVDTTPPTVVLTLAMTNVTSPGNLGLSATADDEGGVTRVEFYERIAGSDEGPTKIGEDASAPYAFQRPFLTAADNGSYELTAKAYDGAGNVGTSNVGSVSVTLAGAPAAFTISASHDRITSPGPITFTAEPTGGISRIEIYERGVKVGESGGAAVPIRATVNVSSAENGTRIYVAKGFGSSGEIGFSNEVPVLVDIRWDLIRSVDGVVSDEILPMATDATGAVYLAGTTVVSSGGMGTDAFLAKYDADGNRIWLQTSATAEGERTYSVGVDPSGRPFITGFVSRPRAEDEDVECLLAVYSAAGNVAWTAPPRDGPCVAATDATGNFYVARSAFDTDLFLTKLDNKGQEIWTRQFGTRPSFPNDDVLTSIAIDPQGGIYVSGYTSGSLDETANRGGRDVFVVKFNAAGNQLWSRQFGTEDHDFGSSLAADPEGGVYVGGGKDHPEFRFGQFGDALVARYTSDGTLAWVRHLDGGGFDDGWSVAADADGVYLAGLTTGQGGTTELNEPVQGPSDAFLAKLSRDGGLQSVRLIGGNGRDGALGVTRATNGAVYVGVRSDGGLPGMSGSGVMIARHVEAIGLSRQIVSYPAR